jgi:hypothetical protein
MGMAINGLGQMCFLQLLRTAFCRISGKPDDVALQAGWTVFIMEAIEE